MRKAIYAGSFDPITNGHLWMIREGAELFDELIVVVGVNPDKRYAFTVDERLDMLRKSTRDMPTVTTDSFENQFLVNYANSLGAQYVLRGIRTESDYQYEREMRHINSTIRPETKSIFLMPPPELSGISSSMVKGLVGPDGWEDVVEAFVPNPVYNKLLHKFRGYFTKWLALCRRLEIENTETPYLQLIDLYSDSQRSYHTLAHIVRSLREFNASRSLSIRPDAVEMALWYHDAIYDTHSRDSEERSAQLAYQALQELGLPKSFADTVRSLILSTKHATIPTYDDAKLITDIDLAILGKPYEEFEEYERDIRDEYRWVPDDQFRAGRKAVLQAFLGRPNIYNTDFFRDKYQDAARRNLEISLSRL